MTHKHSCALLLLAALRLHQACAADPPPPDVLVAHALRFGNEDAHPGEVRRKVADPAGAQRATTRRASPIQFVAPRSLATAAAVALGVALLPQLVRA